jgi:hypothetical protein
MGSNIREAMLTRAGFRLEYHEVGPPRSSERFSERAKSAVVMPHVNAKAHWGCKDFL